MLQFEELRLKLQGMEPELRELKQSLNIDKLGIEIAELERKAAEPSFWDDMENSQKVLQRTAQLKASVETYNKLQALYEDTLTLIELAEEAGCAARQLMAACYLITGECYRPAVECGRICLGRWCAAVRERYHAEACNGMNYLRAAESTTDPCLERLLTELGEASYRQADALLCLLQKSL